MSIIKVTHTQLDTGVVSDGHLLPHLLPSLRKLGFRHHKSAQHLFWSYRKAGGFEYQFDITGLILSMLHSKKTALYQLCKVGDIVELRYGLDSWLFELCNDVSIEIELKNAHISILNGVCDDTIGTMQDM